MRMSGVSLLAQHPMCGRRQPQLIHPPIRVASALSIPPTGTVLSCIHRSPHGDHGRLVVDRASTEYYSKLSKSLHVSPNRLRRPTSTTEGKYMSTCAVKCVAHSPALLNAHISSCLQSGLSFQLADSIRFDCRQAGWSGRTRSKVVLQTCDDRLRQSSNCDGTNPAGQQIDYTVNLFVVFRPGCDLPSGERVRGIASHADPPGSAAQSVSPPAAGAADATTVVSSPENICCWTHVALLVGVGVGGLVDLRDAIHGQRGHERR